jgi:hypothetical protein
MRQEACSLCCALSTECVHILSKPKSLGGPAEYQNAICPACAKEGIERFAAPPVPLSPWRGFDTL